MPIEKLGLPPVIRGFASKPRGLVLVTGPTGSGKSTTLASIINEINETRDDHIMTIEDPIEFLHRHKKCIVNQRELGGDAQAFAMALKAALRQDPDVILVGEMRDMETIGTALTAAETGHLVFATLHTQDAPQTVDRIIDVFPPAQQGQVRAQLAIGLQGIVTQTLVPTADGKGRAVAAEVLVPTPGVRNLIREGKTHQIYSLIQTGAVHGMQTMDASLAGLVRAGRITQAMAETRSSSPEELRKLIEMPPGEGAADREGRLMATFASRRSTSPASPRRADRRRRQEDGHLRAQGQGPEGHGAGGEEVRPQDGAEPRPEAGQGRRADGDVAPAGDDDLVRHDAAARVLRARGADREPEAARDARRRPRGHRGRPDFSDALARHPKVFNPLYVAMVRSGEAGGVLEESLERISDQLEKDDSLRRQVKSAMVYPVVVLTFAMFVLVGMIAFIVPVFVGVFKDFGGELPRSRSSPSASPTP